MEMDKHTQNCFSVLESSIEELSSTASVVLDKCKKSGKKSIPETYRKQIRHLHLVGISALNHLHELRKAIENVTDT